MKRHNLLPILALLAALPAVAGESVDRTVPADANVAIEIENVVGSVEITGWDRDEVRIVGTLGDDVDGLEIEGSGDSIDISVDIPDRRGRGRRDISCDLRLQVPRGSQVEVETVSASIEVEGVSGTLDLESVSGRVEVDGSPSAVDAESVSGSIRISGRNTRVSAESVSGSVKLEGVSGRVDVSSVSGGIEVEAGSVERGDLESVSGSIEFRGSLEGEARFEAQSHSGTVVLLLPADTSANWEVSTFSGNIENEFGPEAERESKYTPEKSVDFTTGDGAARVSVYTFSGNVRLRRR